MEDLLVAQDWDRGRPAAGGGRRLEPLRSFPFDDYQPPPWQPTGDILKLRGMPRYNFPNEFVSLLGYESRESISQRSSSSNDVRNDYLKGLAVGSVVILAVFVVWCLILIVLKCCGRRRVGCASGVPRKLPPRPAGGDGDNFPSESKAAYQSDGGEYDFTMAQYDRKMRRFEWTIFLTRVGFLLAGVFVIVGSILFYVKGIGSLIQSLTDVQDGLTYSSDVLGESVQATDDFIQSSSELRGARDEFRKDVDEFCPAVDLPPVSGLEDVTKMFQDVLKVMDEFGDGLEKEAGGIRNDLAEIQSNVDSLNQTLNDAYGFLYAAIGVSAILIVIVLCLMVSVVLAWKRRQARNCFVRCMKNAVVLPVFILFMVLAWLFATLFLFAAIGGADFCIEPNKNTVAVLEMIQANEGKDDGSDLVFELLKFYVSGCSENLIPKPAEFQQEITLLETAVGAVHGFLEFLQTDNALVMIQSLCQAGGDAFGTMNKTAALLHSQLHIIWSVFIALYEILSCRTMNPLYSNFAHQGMCVSAVSGLAWIFWTQLVIAICSMIMVTLRAAAQEVEDDVEAEGNEDVAVGQNILVPSASKDATAEESPYVENDGEASGGVEKAALPVSGAIHEEAHDKSWLS